MSWSERNNRNIRKPLNLWSRSNNQRNNNITRKVFQLSESKLNRFYKVDV